MSILIPLLVFGFLLAVTIFLDAVVSAPEGTQNQAGFVRESRLQATATA